MSRRLKALFKVLLGALLIGVSFSCFAIVLQPGFRLVRAKKKPLASARKKPPAKKIIPNGIMQVDKKTSLYIITLGRNDGVRMGDLLDVYDKNEKKVGRAKVTNLFDAGSDVAFVGGTHGLGDGFYDVVLIKRQE